MKNTSKKTGTDAAETLAQINAQIEALKQKRIGLATPLKAHFATLRSELAETERQIRELDEAWRPEPMKPRAAAVISQILEANGKPMDETEILKAVGGMLSKWKVRTTLKKRFAVDEAGKYSVKA